jgi:hypothetical protein
MTPDHCPDILRQKVCLLSIHSFLCLVMRDCRTIQLTIDIQLTCDADVGTVMYAWVEGKPQAFPDFNTYEDPYIISLGCL